MSNWKDEYKKKLVSAKEAVSHIKSNDKVILAHVTAEPLDLLDALCDPEICSKFEHVRISNSYSLGMGGYAKPGMEKHFDYVSFFLTSTNKECIKSGRGDYVPISLREMDTAFIFDKRECEVLLTIATLPDENGYVSLGVAGDYTVNAIKRAKLVIAELTPHMPWTYGDNKVHISEFDYIVESNRELPELPYHEIGEDDKKIAEYAASLIDDGSTIQVGVGVIPNAVMALVKDKKDLGIHTEVLSDWAVDLYECGALTGKAKALHPGKIVAASVEGSKKIYDFIDHNEDVLMMPASYVNNPAVIAKNSKMVCINACVEIDLLGQAASESANGFQISGSGGQLNFFDGANISEDGKGLSIITIKSCYIDKNGKRHSRIVPYFGPFTPITTPRNCIDYVVTEYGIAPLRWHTAKERAKALISIAHPDFREELTRVYEEHFGYKL